MSSLSFTTLFYNKSYSQEMEIGINPVFIDFFQILFLYCLLASCKQLLNFGLFDKP